MKNYTFTEFAESDVVDIWQQLREDDSEATADRVIQRIYEECAQLSEMPGMGHYREELLDRSKRFWRVWSYLIVYKWQVSPIEIVAIVHGARDLADFFKHDPR